MLLEGIRACHDNWILHRVKKKKKKKFSNYFKGFETW